MKHVSLSTLPQREVSHNPLIKKQMMIGFDELKPLAQFARAVFPPGECAPGHAHDNMSEVFFVEKGCGVMRLDGVDHPFAAGECITVHPGENHELRNPGNEEFIVLYFGVFMTPAGG